MEEEFLGPYCMEIQLTNKQINNLNIIKPLTNQCIKIGLIFELQTYFKNLNKVIDIIKSLQPDLSSSNQSTLKTRINRAIETKKKLVSKKKVGGISSVDELNRKPFGTPAKKLFVTPCKSIEHSPDESLICEHGLISPRQNETELCTSEIKVNRLECEKNENEQNKSSYDGPNISDTIQFSKDATKTLNSYEYELNRKKKALQQINKQIDLLKENVKVLDNKIGHFSVRNVNKRDETSRKNLRLLRETERQLLRQKRQGLVDSESIERLTLENNHLKEKQNEEQNYENKLQEQKKLQAQKTASYYKVRATKLAQKLKSDLKESDLVKSLRSKVSENEAKVRELEINNDILKEQINQQACETKNVDGTFSDNLRMCIIELSGLEVAVEKVPNVIKTVSKHLFGKDLRKTDLPSSTTVQTIVDEGHYLAKAFISKQLSETENWGLNRDGTTRKKQKILDTTITLSSGDVLSLGFNRVAHETAETINNVTKNHMNELANVNANMNKGVSTDSFVKTSLEKLAFTMSDRASNEKKADRLLDNWRDEVLKVCDETQHLEVLHFHCMAHVLLGFHRYIGMNFKEHESGIVSEHGPLGRDSLSVFKFWNTKGTVVERTIRTVSEVFGPVGDHHGVRDLWEAYCAANGLKSVIGNYKDNRFNALFQTAAEIFVHRDDFINVLETVKTPNLKLKSVLADLKSDIIMTLIQCLGLFYLRITGPYWKLLTSNKVPYVELYPEINDIRNFLEICEVEPANIWHLDSHWSNEDPHDISDFPYRQLLRTKLSVIIETENGLPCREILLNTVKLVASSMKKTVDKQLVDFLPDGKFGVQPSKDNLQRTAFAHVNNLACEHHFGDLDSSQRRRPSASMHHHSSVQLLKRNRLQMISWLNKMPRGERENVMKKARKGGKQLRDEHRTQEKSVMSEINADMTQMKEKGQKRKMKNMTGKVTKKHKCNEDDSLEEENYFNEENQFQRDWSKNDVVKENVYIAVAYQDAWYPGIVSCVNTNRTLVVKFMSPARKVGHFCWPAREDIQTVEKDFILKIGFVPNCLNSGRMWQIKENDEINKLFEKFKNYYF
ncbi:Piwi-like protein 1 [Mactra antiquata]